MNLCRSWNWKIFDSHGLCSKSRGKSDHCMFCRLRSTCLRLNDAKRLRKIKLVEFTSVIKKLSCNIYDPSKMNLSLSEMLEASIQQDENLNRHFVGFQSTCINCKMTVSVNNSPVLTCSNFARTNYR